MTSVNVADFPLSQVSDTSISVPSSALPSRRVLIFITGTATNNAHAIDLADYVPGLADIEGVFYNTIDSNYSVTALTWSTTTLTFANAISSNTMEVCVVGRLT